MEGEKSYLMPIILICVGIYYLWDKKNRSNENELDKKVSGSDFIGGALGYLIWAPDY